MPSSSSPPQDMLPSFLASMKHVPLPTLSTTGEPETAQTTTSVAKSTTTISEDIMALGHLLTKLEMGLAC